MRSRGKSPSKKIKNQTMSRTAYKQQGQHQVCTMHPTAVQCVAIIDQPPRATYLPVWVTSCRRWMQSGQGS